MRIYQIDGATCFDTDDVTEARLLDAYALTQFEEGAQTASAIIADWLEDLLGEASGVSTLIDIRRVARRIRSGEWRSL